MYLAMLAVATIAASSVASAPSLRAQMSGDGKGAITLNAALGLPQGDHKDAGVDTMILIGADYGLGVIGQGTTASSFVGILGAFGSGDNDLDSRTFGVHYGLMFPLTPNNPSLPLMLKAQVGYYNTRLSNGDSDEKWAIGGLAALSYGFKSGDRTNFSLELGYYLFPEVNGADNNGFFVGASFPLNTR